MNEQAGQAIYNSYKTLGVKKNSTPAEIRKRYQGVLEKIACQKQTPAVTRQIVAYRDAYIELIDPGKRATHDRNLGMLKEGAEAKWRQHYKDYTNDELERDLGLADDLIEHAKSIDRPIVNWKIFAFIMALLVIAAFTLIKMVIS